MTTQTTRHDKWQDYDRFQQKPALLEYYHSINFNNVAAIQSLGRPPFQRAVDLAAGCGTSTHPLRQVARSVIGVDASRQLIRIARGQNTDPHVRFLCKRAEDYQPREPVELVCASWLLNYFHAETELVSFVERIHSMLTADGCVSFVVPSAAFFSPQVQRVARELYDFEVAPLSDNGSSTVGIFSYANEWIKTTVWQPLHLMRICRPWLDLREWDVKGTLVRENLLPRLDFEPPYTVLYGTKRGEA
jgi:SAM-dependent methyltransferase